MNIEIMINDMNDPIEVAQQMMDELFNVAAKLESLKELNGIKFIHHITSMCLMLLAEHTTDKEVLKQSYIEMVVEIFNFEPQDPLPLNN